MGLLNIGLIIVFKIQIWNNKILQQEKKCVLLKKWKRFPKNIHKYIRQFQKLIQKLKYVKSQNHKNVYSHTCHAYLYNKQLHKPRFFNNILMTYKQYSKEETAMWTWPSFTVLTHTSSCSSMSDDTRIILFIN